MKLLLSLFASVTFLTGKIHIYDVKYKPCPEMVIHVAVMDGLIIPHQNCYYHPDVRDWEVNKQEWIRSGWEVKETK